MGLFDKKYCDICGEKIGLFGNKKLEDGNMCKHCAKKLSPWFEDRRHTDLAGIKEQLAYREDNKKDVEKFHVTRELGESMRVLLDEDAGLFMVTDADLDELLEANPDVLSYDDVKECNLDVDETRTEHYWEDEEGNRQHYNPRRYEYRYRFNLQIVVDHPYFDDIRFQVNEYPLEIEYCDRSLFGTGSFHPERDSEYRKYLDIANEIIDVLTGEYEEEGDEEIFTDEDGNEIEVVTCPWCGGRSRRTYTGCCENCGGNLDAE